MMKRILPLLCIGIAACAGNSEPVVQLSPAQLQVEATVDQFFDAMRDADSTALRFLLHPEARLMTVTERDGVTTLGQASIDAFVQNVGTPRGEILDERITDITIEVDDALATAWMHYQFYVGDEFSHCGVNAFQLMRASDGWKVFQITDTRRREGC